MEIDKNDAKIKKFSSIFLNLLFYKKKYIRHYFPYLILLFLVLTAFYPFIFNNKIFSDGDAVLQQYAYNDNFHNLANSKIESGSIHYDPFILSGFLSHTLSLGVFFNPFYILFHKFFSAILAYNLLNIIFLFLAGIFTYLFCLNLGLNRGISLFSSLTYIFSQFLMMNVGGAGGFALVYILPPLLLLLLVKIKKSHFKHKIFLSLIGSFALGLTWLGGFSQLIVYSHLFAFSFAFYLDFTESDRESPLLKKYTCSINMILMALMGAFIGAVEIIPMLLFGSLSVRDLGVGFKEAMGHMNFFDFFNFFIPNFHLPFLNRGEQVYIGFLPLFFTFVVWRKKISKIIFFKIWFLIVLFSIIIYSPLVFIYQHLPVLNFFRNQSRLLLIGTFCLSIIAGYGLQYFMDHKDFPCKLFRFLKRFLFVFLSAVFLVNIVFYIFKDFFIKQLHNYFNFYFYSKTTQLPLQYYYETIDRYVENIVYQFSLKNPYLLVGLVSWILGIVVLWYAMKKEIIKKHLIKYSVAISIISLLILYPGAYKPADASILNRRNPIVDFIKSKEEDLNSFRIYSFLYGFSHYSKLNVPYGYEPEEDIAFDLGQLAPNSNIYYGLQSADGYHNLMTRRSAEILALIGSNRSTASDRLVDSSVSIDKKIELFLDRLNLLRTMNVKYIISAIELPEHQGIKYLYAVRATKYQIPVYLYELLDYSERVFSPSEVNFTLSDNFLNKIIKSQEVKNKAFIECENNCYNETSELNKIVDVDYNYKQIKIIVDYKTKGWLVLNESFIPGWTAIIDGEEENIYRANYLYQAVQLPPGKHIIEFKYNFLDLLKDFF